MSFIYLFTYFIMLAFVHTSFHNFNPFVLQVLLFVTAKP